MQIPRLYPKGMIQEIWNGAQASLELAMSQVILPQMPYGTALREVTQEWSDGGRSLCPKQWDLTVCFLTC